jgi:hypothetical protein
LSIAPEALTRPPFSQPFVLKGSALRLEGVEGSPKHVIYLSPTKCISYSPQYLDMTVTRERPVLLYIDPRQICVDLAQRWELTDLLKTAQSVSTTAQGNEAVTLSFTAKNGKAYQATFARSANWLPTELIEFNPDGKLVRTQVKAFYKAYPLGDKNVWFLGQMEIREWGAGVPLAETEKLAANLERAKWASRRTYKVVKFEPNAAVADNEVDVVPANGTSVYDWVAGEHYRVGDDRRESLPPRPEPESK